MPKGRSLWLTVAALSLALVAGQAFAGTTGKLNGVVKDQKGDPLPGVSVVLEGTKRGSVTDANGYFFVINLDPGVYRVTASIIGYDKETRTNVSIQADHTTELSFALKETAVQMGEVVVQAERPPVEPDRTTSKYVMTAQDIQNVPIVRSAQGLIELQGGVSLDGEVSFRAGDAGDVTYYVDGVKLVNNDAQGYRQFRSINRSAIQEMTVITGGMEAEYGNAQGGIVSIVSRDGDPKVHGYIDYQFTPAGKKHWGPNVYDSALHRGNNKWKDAAWVAETVTLPGGSVAPAHNRLDYTKNVGHWVEGNLSGPLSRNATFFVSAQWSRTARSTPQTFLVTPTNYNTTFKVAYTVSPNLKVRVGGILQRGTGNFTGPTSGGALNLSDNGKNLFLTDPSPAGKYRDQERLGYVSLTHSLSPKSFYELKLSYSQSVRDTFDLRSNTLTADPIKDRAGYYTLYRPAANWELRDQRRYMAKLDFSNQATKGHFLKAGFDYTQYNSWWLRYWSDALSHRRVQWFSKSYGAISLFPGQGNEGATPRQLGVYLQDKMEFEGMIVNAGIRYDLFDAGVKVKNVDVYYGSPMYSSMTRMLDMPTRKVPLKQTVSPRVGVSHPITASSLVKFFYGKFYQLPTFQNLIGNDWISQRATDIDLNKNGQIDPAEKWNGFEWMRDSNQQSSPRLKPEETTQFQAGVDWNFVSDYTLSLTSYYKSSGNQIPGQGSLDWRDPKVPGYVVSGGNSYNGTFDDIRGLEIAINKRFSKMFMFNLAYNLQWADAGRNSAHRKDSQPDSMFVVNGHYWVTFDVDPATGKEIPVDLVTQATREKRAPDYYIKAYGAEAQRRYREEFLNTVTRQYQSWWEVKDLSLYNFDGKGSNVYVMHNQETGERVPQGRDQRAFGKMDFMLNTPPDFGPSNGKVLGNIRANLIYWMFSGRVFDYTPPGGQVTKKYAPMHTRVDLNAEKQLGKESGLNLTLAVEVLNLFNQKDKILGTTSGSGQNSSFNADRYMRWGVEGLGPTDPDLVNYGDPYELTNYYDYPRQMRISMRIRW